MTPGEAASIAAVAADLRRKIYAGQYATGSKVPSRQALSDEHGISRESAGVALRMLAAEGLVSLEQGRGTIVLARRAYRAEAVIPRAGDAAVTDTEAQAVRLRLEAAVRDEPAASGLEIGYRHDLGYGRPDEAGAPALVVRLGAETGGPKTAGLAQAVAVALAVISSALRDAGGWDLSGASVEARPADGDQG